VVEESRRRLVAPLLQSFSQSWNQGVGPGVCPRPQSKFKQDLLPSALSGYWQDCFSQAVRLRVSVPYCLLPERLPPVLSRRDFPTCNSSKRDRVTGVRCHRCEMSQGIQGHNGTQDREKPWEPAAKPVVRFPPIPSLYRDMGDFSDVSGNVCYHQFEGNIWMVEFATYTPFLTRR
jgi:hypothetical protein